MPAQSTDCLSWPTADEARKHLHGTRISPRLPVVQGAGYQERLAMRYSTTASVSAWASGPKGRFGLV